MDLIDNSITEPWKRNAELRRLAHNPNTDAKTLAELARIGNSSIRAAVACNKNVSRETILILSEDIDYVVRYEAARNETHEEWLRRQKALFQPLSTL
ncbi:hypothetical protein [Gilliamella bombi]|uniref:hypothetical protein n=1 Tax=Gilliamella bombi TaxID=1908521 RepID=UPI000A151C71|nr:hypothetical protein [Gilliamella bombi]